MTITGFFERFQYFNFETNFFKNGNLFFKKNGFLVENTRIENAIFQYKTVQSEANVKTNRMGSTRWIYHKEWSFDSNYFIFSEILFQFKNLVQRVDLIYQTPKCPYSYFSKVLVLFPWEYLNEFKLSFVLFLVFLKKSV